MWLNTPTINFFWCFNEKLYSLTQIFLYAALLVSFQIENFQIYTVLVLFCLTILSSVYLSPLAFHYKQQEETQRYVHALLKNLLSSTVEFSLPHNHRKQLHSFCHYLTRAPLPSLHSNSSLIPSAASLVVSLKSRFLLKLTICSKEFRFFFYHTSQNSFSLFTYLLQKHPLLGAKICIHFLWLQDNLPQNRGLAQHTLVSHSFCRKVCSRDSLWRSKQSR